MARIKGTIEVDTEMCKGCNLCVTSCPQNVLELSQEVNKKGYHYAYMKNPDQCTGCANCGIICPDGVISVYRKKMELTAS